MRNRKRFAMIENRIQNKIVVVTGASEGIGLAVARLFAENGARVVLASRDPEKLKIASAEIQGQSTPITCDVSKPEDVIRLKTAVMETFGTIDILINNAGVTRFKPTWETTLEDWQTILNTNLTGTFLVTRAFLPEFMQKKSGHIVNLVSVAGNTAFPNCSAYCSSKFGQLGFTRVLRQELIPYNVRVTAVLPGATDTAIWNDFEETPDRGRMMRPRDVAEVVWSACNADVRATPEEIVLRPTSGDV
ncbi:MAG: SDR family oxidoreductase [Calditrichaeota bacterium]|nr:SDR family oxidoreductase [Calditrichota bacterium]